MGGVAGSHLVGLGSVVGFVDVGFSLREAFGGDVQDAGQGNREGAVRWGGVGGIKAGGVAGWRGHDRGVGLRRVLLLGYVLLLWWMQAVEKAGTEGLLRVLLLRRVRLRCQPVFDSILGVGAGIKVGIGIRVFSF